MKKMRFSKLYLLSRNERAGLEISFSNRPVLVRAPNNHGKSAILKSLYDSFGAQPHKIDDSWRGANVISLVLFSIGNDDYSILKAAGEYSIFDAQRKILLSTRKVGEELTPFLANLLNFRLVMADRKDRVITPPPAYMFSPFYVDQDHGWTKPWTSFSNMYLPNSARLLSEYHSGLRPNEYYEAVAERERLRALTKTIELEINAINEAIKKVKTSTSEVTLTYELNDFSAETERLISESKKLHIAEFKYREELAKLHQEYQLWSDQKDVLNGAIHEMDGALSVAAKHPEHVECPTCGQGYDNSLVEQFGLVEDLDGLISARLNANKKISELEGLISKHRSNLSDIEKSLILIDATFAVKKEEITFRDVVAAEGRTEATKLLQGRLDELDTHVRGLAGDIAQQDARIKNTQERGRTDAIKDEFAVLLAEFSKSLDVRLDDKRRPSLSGVNIGRGSEGPRALLAYYYAFLRVAFSHSSMSFCPIVIDAPNQQGQDKTHMPAMMKLMIKQAPKDCQLIIAAEDQYGLSDDEIETIDVTGEKDHVLRTEQYKHVSEVIRPYTITSI